MKSLRRTTILLLALASALVLTTVSADVETVRGAIVEVAPPASVNLGATESDEQMILFEEMENFVLPSDILVDTKHRTREEKQEAKNQLALQDNLETRNKGKDHDKKGKKNDKDDRNKRGKKNDKDDRNKRGKKDDKNDRNKRDDHDKKGKKNDKDDRNKRDDHGKKDKKNDKNDRSKRDRKPRYRPAMIPAGTEVNSYLIHLDPVNTNRVKVTGCVQFDTKVLGVIYTAKKLYATDSMLGNPGTTYPDPDIKARGADRRDLVLLRKGSRILCLNLRAAPYMDQVRVITEPNDGAGGSSEDVPDDTNDVTPVGFWKFDETSGDTATDSSGNDNHGTLMADATWTPGQLDGALAFDGEGDGVMIPNPEELHDLDSITVSMWFYGNSVSPHGKGTLISKDDSFVVRFSNTNYRVHFSAKRWDGETGRWRFATENLDSLMGAWHHLVFVYDYSSEDNDAVAYLDGVELEAQEAGTPVPPVVSESGDLVIGNDSSGNWAFDGMIDDVRIYNDLLTEEEITDLFNGS